MENGLETAWAEASSYLEEISGLDTDHAHDTLAQAWGWKNWATCSSAIARKYLRPIKPDAEAVKRSLEWLKEGPLEMDKETLRAGLISSPEAYLKDPATNYKRALKMAPSQWKDPAEFKTLLFQDPSVLERTTIVLMEDVILSVGTVGCSTRENEAETE
eukprot:CAMPEP_0113310550 /NCGR_PEP_ID=MMETSP0010_2-20120614/8153_1 /TAXON_ID=216773 ORGANISM="Corethron hystrix, Strain 308" /NCGR_SAMPLE_ID=MMETSP0010_2 /ASSEMBLY_ACC=CAM_ASM_000155 /LENGTH=158 /DNA_ID=CAMNT_0000166033 /DNA_START=255 /DNA_END=732 /DNA_ORIENTATION=- /assembly_acc=CAM_ASM_000155